MLKEEKIILAYIVHICYNIKTVRGYILAIWASVSTNHRKWSATGLSINQGVGFFVSPLHYGIASQPIAKEEPEMNIALEGFGYLGTGLILMSMMMTSVFWLRILNLSGSVISMIYAVLTNAWPVALLNTGLIVINTIQLLRLKKAEA